MIPINTNLQVRHKSDGGCSKLGQLFAWTALLKWSSLVQMVSTPPYKSKFTRERVEAELNCFYSRLNVVEKFRVSAQSPDGVAVKTAWGICVFQPSAVMMLSSV